MAGRAKVKGMYLRGKKWWLRYTPHPGKPQERVPLDTPFESVAAAKAVAILQRAPIDRTGEFEALLDEYLGDVLGKGLLSRTFSPTRRYVLLAFAREHGVTSLKDFTFYRIEKWVETMRERGVKPGTIESYVMHARALGTWLVKNHRAAENVAAKIELGKLSRVVRKNFVESAAVRRVIKNASQDDLRFVLFCGFHEGMRRLEIVEAAPEWFHLGRGEKRGFVAVGKTATFTPKDRDERTIPLSREFEDFLRGYLKKLPAGAQWVLHPEKAHGKSKYRWDFVRPFKTHMAAQKVRCTIHDMRRSFVSNKLVEDGTLIFKLAKWTGDTVQVLQDHYGHLLEDDASFEKGL